MAITKTNFINYIRCPRFCALEEIKKDKLDAPVTIEEYQNEALEEIKTELLGYMFDEEGNNIVDQVSKQLEIMMPYYNKVELLAGKAVKERFGGTPKYSEDTYNQQDFECNIKGIKYLCYVDIYNETDNGFDIIEVKATTTKKFLDLGKKGISIFEKDERGILRLKDEQENFMFDEVLDEKAYNRNKAKLFNKYQDTGHYVYDLAVQRYIIENDLKENNRENEINNIKYYLAVLNSEYIFDGVYKDGKPVYGGIITFIDLTQITKKYMDKIELDRQRVDGYINNLDASKCPVGEFCELKKTTKCKYSDICFNLPEKNSILAYINNHFGFTDELGIKHYRYDLINEGKKDMMDIPEAWLTRKANVIQRDCVENQKDYIDSDKIIKGLEEITYPIYHLDFETFPCPLPRLKGETSYSQSVFQFSIHIEKEPGVCDKDNDHYEYLARDHKDNREEIIKKLLEYIDVDKPGTVLAYNDSFEKGRLKELGNIFPEYKDKLNKMISMTFDLMNIVKTKSSLYQELGFEEERSKLFNYYHYEMNGSFSIKKVLPRFSDLTYTGMNVSNGMDALITYANYPNMKELEFKEKTEALVEYCKQDTWAMVVILNGLRKKIKEL